MWEFVLALLLGIVVGTFTGITPGIHINTITAVLLANLSVFSSFSTNSLIAFIVSLAIAHTILDFIPSILTGATDEESFLSVLPGHEMLKQGKGKEAILMVLIGVITSIPLILIITPFFITFILIFISVYLITREDRCWTALVIFLATGFLGFSTLNSPVENSLLPLLGGLFGSSSIIISLSQKISYNKISICMLLILISIVIISSSWLGLLVFITSTAWGIFAILSNVRRINMMGVLLFPTIIFYLTNQF